MLYKPRNDNKGPPPVRFITRFSQQQELRNILGRHWYIVLNYPYISKYIKNYPDIVLRRAPSVRDQLTSSHYIPNSDHPCAFWGIATCGRCNMCPWIHQGTEFVLPNGQVFTPRFHVDCNTPGIVYLITCVCGAFYVGKTIRPFRKRINDHMYYLSSAK